MRLELVKIPLFRSHTRHNERLSELEIEQQNSSCPFERGVQSHIICRLTGGPRPKSATHQLLVAAFGVQRWSIDSRVCPGCLSVSVREAAGMVVGRFLLAIHERLTQTSGWRKKLRPVGRYIHKAPLIYLSNTVMAASLCRLCRLHRLNRTCPGPTLSVRLEYRVLPPLSSRSEFRSLPLFM